MHDNTTEVRIFNDVCVVRQNNSKGKEKSPIRVEEFFEHFRNLSDTNNDKEDKSGVLNNDEKNETKLDTSSLNGPFHEDEIKKCIMKLKNNKAAGVDLVANEYIKCTGDLFLPLYVSLFNKIMISGSIPEDWVIGLIRPIYKKKGDVENCNNYRGIALLSCFGKLFTSVLNNRLL